MAAIPVAAARCQADDIGKVLSYAAFGPQDAELTHAWAVDDQGTTFKDDQFSADGRVPSLARAADILRLEHFPA